MDFWLKQKWEVRKTWDEIGICIVQRYKNGKDKTVWPMIREKLVEGSITEALYERIVMEHNMCLGIPNDAILDAGLLMGNLEQYILTWDSFSDTYAKDEFPGWFLRLAGDPEVIEEHKDEEE